MPADYRSAAEALAMPTSPSPPASPAAAPAAASPDRSETSPPPWTRPRASSSLRRLSSRPYALHSSSSSRPQRFFQRALDAATSAGERAWKLFLQLPPAYRVLTVVGMVVAATLGVVFLVFGARLFHALAPVAQSWRALPLGWLVVWLLTAATAFPPLMGYGTALTVSGFVYDFPGGWPIAATATVAGSTAAFLASRRIFSTYVHRLVGRDRRFVALAQVLRRDGLGVLTMIRFCPLPFSLSNGFLATIPSVPTWAFALSTALSTPKLLIHIFIGSRLARLAEEGDSMPTGDRVLNYVSMLVSGTVGFVVGLIIYRRTMARAAELALEGEDGVSASADLDRERGEEEGPLLRPPGLAAVDDVPAVLMDEDDISLWEAEGVEGGYRDSWDEEEAVGAGIPTGKTGNGTD